MNASTEGRVESKKKQIALKSAIIWSLVTLSYVGGVSFYKNTRFSQLTREGLQTVKITHSKVEGLFQGSFYFFYEDQFVPGIKEVLRSVQNKRPDARIQRVLILSPDSQAVLFDSKTPEKPRSSTTLKSNSNSYTISLAATEVDLSPLSHYTKFMESLDDMCGLDFPL